LKFHFLDKVAHRTWLALREHGAMVEEADDSSDAGGGIVGSYDEKVVVSEKAEDSAAGVPVAVDLQERFRDVG
jgi:hypothetical protein